MAYLLRLASTGMLVLLSCLICFACSPAPKNAQSKSVTFFDSSAYPQRLSDWNLFARTTSGLTLSANNHLYTINTALFSDYAHKIRTIHVPSGSQLTYQDFDAFTAPTGTIISKTFFYHVDENQRVLLDTPFDGSPERLGDHKLIETRLLVKQASGWEALPYVWSGDDAYLAITGDLQTLPTSIATNLNYLVPTKNQCASCHATNHTTAAIQPIGIKARHLNRAHPQHHANQLQHLSELNLLEGLPDAPWPANAQLSDANLEHAARSYLDINCGHCHNPQGAADTSGLLLDYQDHSARDLGTCKPPIAAGRGSGGLLYSIVPGHADQSIMSYRLRTIDPGTMMPELGRSIVHEQGLDLINRWIDQQTGECL